MQAPTKLSLRNNTANSRESTVTITIHHRTNMLPLDTLLAKEVRYSHPYIVINSINILTNEFFLEANYEEGGDPFISGDLEINNEIYNNPAVMVGY